MIKENVLVAESAYKSQNIQFGLSMGSFFSIEKKLIFRFLKLIFLANEHCFFYDSHMDSGYVELKCLLKSQNETQ